MTDPPDKILALIQRAASGDAVALNELLECHRDRLKKMVRIRLNRRLQGRVDASDVIQDAYLEAARRLPEYLQQPRVPLFLWLRKITSHKLIDVHRRHLLAQARDPGLEVVLGRDDLPVASSDSLAEELLGRFTSPSEAVAREETRLAVQEALAKMSEIDREILSLRHFEDLSNVEAAQELGIEEKTASKRYVRALLRFETILAELGLVT
jgi:RNA polymerase sigma-70 factor (ECF subfamily)